MATDFEKAIVWIKWIGTQSRLINRFASFSFQDRALFRTDYFGFWQTELVTLRGDILRVISATGVHNSCAS
ncbi:hypothetical protein [Bradyrhizobium sp.]|uniref:hypothetical protein n=1 Tax=Bradyrhizobium sp. TaxID=376 RepID=UPI0025BDE1BA|nr:hypothetical protein [Bradyrhizobium sp.]